MRTLKEIIRDVRASKLFEDDVYSYAHLKGLGDIAEMVDNDEDLCECIQPLIKSLQTNENLETELTNFNDKLSVYTPKAKEFCDTIKELHEHCNSDITYEPQLVLTVTRIDETKTKISYHNLPASTDQISNGYVFVRHTIPTQKQGQSNLEYFLELSENGKVIDATVAKRVEEYKHELINDQQKRVDNASDKYFKDIFSTQLDKMLNTDFKVVNHTYISPNYSVFEYNGNKVECYGKDSDQLLLELCNI
jgi:hypothetical protein